jgi:hypothetical protein
MEAEEDFAKRSLWLQVVAPPAQGWMEAKEDFAERSPVAPSHGSTGTGPDGGLPCSLRYF